MQLKNPAEPWVKIISTAGWTVFGALLPLDWNVCTLLFLQLTLELYRSGSYWVYLLDMGSLTVAKFQVGLESTSKQGNALTVPFFMPLSFFMSALYCALPLPASRRDWCTLLRVQIAFLRLNFTDEKDRTSNLGPAAAETPWEVLTNISCRAALLLKELCGGKTKKLRFQSVLLTESQWSINGVR